MPILVHSFLLALAAVTVHGSVAVDEPHAQRLLSPPVPNPVSSVISVPLQDIDSLFGLSVPQNSAFFGFSIDISDIIGILGPNSFSLQVPFLNLMLNLKERAGGTHIRIGNNSRDGISLQNKHIPDLNASPPLIFSPEVLGIIANVSTLANVRWYMGIPFGDTQSSPKQEAEVDEDMVLAKHFDGFQTDDDPDSYSRLRCYAARSVPSDCVVDIGLSPKQNQVWSTDSGIYNLNPIALVNRHPTDSCAHFSVRSLHIGEEFPSLLNHAFTKELLLPYDNSTSCAHSLGQPSIVFETVTTASCEGSPAMDNNFSATLWGVDYALQVAYSNFTSALFGIGGQSDDNSPLGPLSTKHPSSHQWTIGPIYYSALFVAEALGSSNDSQVLDLNRNGRNASPPGYAIYEHGNVTRIALINYDSDLSDGNDYIASISIVDGTPAQVRVKYLTTSFSGQKDIIRWAGQTLSVACKSKGRLMGTVDVHTINCDRENHVCNVRVPTPGAALVFLSNKDFEELDNDSVGFPSITRPIKLDNTSINPISHSGLSSNGNKSLLDMSPTAVYPPSKDMTFAHVLSILGTIIGVCFFVGMECLLSYSINGRCFPFRGVILAKSEAI